MLIKRGSNQWRWLWKVHIQTLHIMMTQQANSSLNCLQQRWCSLTPKYSINTKQCVKLFDLDWWQLLTHFITRAFIKKTKIVHGMGMNPWNQAKWNAALPAESFHCRWVQGGCFVFWGDQCSKYFLLCILRQRCSQVFETTEYNSSLKSLS